MKPLVSDRRLYLNADKSKAVEEGDPRASFLLVAAGSELPGEDAERLGITAADDGKLELPGAEKQSKKAGRGKDGDK